MSAARGGGVDYTNTEALLNSTEQDDAFCSLGRVPLYATSLYISIKTIQKGGQVKKK